MRAIPWARSILLDAIPAEGSLQKSTRLLQERAGCDDDLARHPFAEDRLVQTWHDPLVNGIRDAQELSKTNHQVTMAKTGVWHSLSNHYFPCTSQRLNGSSVRTTASG